jgi:hypothetical protein
MVLVGLLLVVAVVSEVLAAALLPNLHLDRDFTWYGRRGALILLRGLLSLGIGVLVGAVVGRLLPGMLVAAFASVLIFTAVSLGMDRWTETDAIAQPYGLDREGGRLLGQRTELASGELVDSSELLARGISIEAIDPDGGLYASVEDVGRPEKIIGWDRELIVPGRLYPQIVLRESAVLGSTSLLLALGAVAVVGRRRPG